MSPLISVCIPAYNRAAVLLELLDSISGQDFSNYEIVVCEDRSPERNEIAQIVRHFDQAHPGLIKYFENEKNLGYDANLRRLIEKASGDYCLFMGNDDLMCLGALTKVATAVGRYSDVGVVLRSYSAFEGTPDNIVQTFKYFDREIYFPAGERTISTVFRRSVVIPGMVVHRQSALRFTTDRFDGTLLYQLYLIANILVEKSAVYLPDVIVLYRNCGVPDFGNSESEKGRFVPKERTIESSIGFMRGMLEIASYVERTRGVSIYEAILKDIGNYSYGALMFQGDRPKKEFIRYWRGLARLGFGRNLLFHGYALSIFLFGTARMDKMITLIKRRLGHTPAIGNVYRGQEK